MERHSICLVCLVTVILAAGCTGTKENPPVTTVPSATILPVTTPAVPPETIHPPTPAPAPAATAVLPENPDTLTYAKFTGNHFSLEYPAGWHITDRSLPFDETAFINGGYIPADSSVLKREVLAFSGADRAISFTVTTVDTTGTSFQNNGKVLLQESGVISYGDIPSYMIRGANLTGGDPNKTVPVSSFGTGPQRFAPLRSYFLEYNLRNGTTLYESHGVMYLIPGHHISGFFVFAAPPEQFDAWRKVADRMTNSLSVDSYF